MTLNLSPCLGLKLSEEHRVSFLHPVIMFSALVLSAGRQNHVGTKSCLVQEASAYRGKATNLSPCFCTPLELIGTVIM